MIWNSVDEKLPDSREAVVIKCKGYPPMLASYIDNPNCFCSDACCKVWVQHDSKYLSRLVNGTVVKWAKLPD